MKNFIVWAILVGGGNYLAAKWYLHYSVSNDLDNAIVMVSPYADIQYEGVSSTMTGELSIDGITARFGDFRDDVYIDKISVKTPSFLHLIDLGDVGYDFVTGELDVPKSMGFALTGVRAPINADYVRWAYKESVKKIAPGEDAEEPGPKCAGKYGFSPSELEQLGYEYMDVSMSMSYEQDESDFILNMDVDITDMWAMAMSMTMAGNVAQQALRGNYRPRLVEGKLQYTDKSLNDRIRKNCERAGLDADQIVAAQIEAFSYDAEELGIVYDEYVLEPYKEFLAGKSVFVMTAKPTEPIAFSQIDLYKPSDVPALLNLSASTH